MKVKFDFSELREFTETLGTKKNLDKYSKMALREITKEIVDCIKKYTPVDSGVLLKGWDKRKISIVKQSNGYQVKLVNDVPYALAVNDGHYSHNQYNKGLEPYVVQNRTVPYYAGCKDETFVYGHFFVEKGIAEYAPKGDLEKIVMRNLEKWWTEL